MFRMSTVEVEQMVPFPGKLLAQARAALAEARATRWDFAERVNALRAQAVTALAMLYEARREGALVDENVALLDRFIAVVQTKYSAGTASQSDVLRAQVERDGLRAERVRFRRDEEVAASALNVLLDRAPDAPLGEVAPLPAPAATRPLTALLAEAEHLRPALEASRARQDAQRERLSRAELEWAPDLAVTGAYMHDFNMGVERYAVGGGLSLPVWVGRIRAGVREAEAEVRRAEAETRGARDRVLDEVRAAASRLAAAAERHRIVRDDALPRAAQNVEVTEAAYTAGQVDFLSLIDAQRMRLMQQLELERTRAERTIAEAELRRAVGLPGLPTPTETTKAGTR
jgi:outer membrane protein TolC